METENKKVEVTDDMVLGYRDYKIDRKTKKDFPTLDSVVEWLAGLDDHTTEATKEFFDFAEQEYGIDVVIDRMFDPNANFDYGFSTKKEDVRMWFDRRDFQMRAANFKEAKIKQ